MSNDPLVSVLVTVFNRQAYLEETLRSVLASWYTTIEVIVVDDCSSDRSLEIANGFAAKDSRVKVIQNDSNLGDYANRAKAASLATGKYLKYVDSDDLIYPHALTVMVDAVERDESIACALSHSLPEDDKPYPWVLSPKAAYEKHFLGHGCFACGPTGAIIRRTVFEKVCGFRAEWGVLSDIDLWLRMAARWPIALLPPGLVWWRRHAGQEFASHDAAQYYLRRGYELSVERIRSADSPLTVHDSQVAIARIKRHHARRILSLALRNQQPRSAWHLWKESGLNFRQLLGGLKKYR